MTFSAPTNGQNHQPRGNAKQDDCGSHTGSLAVRLPDSDVSKVGPLGGLQPSTFEHRFSRSQSQIVSENPPQPSGLKLAGMEGCS